MTSCYGFLPPYRSSENMALQKHAQIFYTFLTKTDTIPPKSNYNYAWVKIRSVVCWTGENSIKCTDMNCYVAFSSSAPGKYLTGEFERNCVSLKSFHT